MQRLRQKQEETALKLKIAKDEAALRRIKEGAESRKDMRPGKLFITIHDGDEAPTVSKVPLRPAPLIVKTEVKEEKKEEPQVITVSVSVSHVQVRMSLY